MGAESSKTCVIRGEPVLHPGSARDLAMNRRFEAGGPRVDGVNTMVGVVCSHCMPVINRALNEPAFDAKERQRIVRQRIKDPAFINAAIQDNARARVDGILGNLNGDTEWSRDVRELKEFLLQNLNKADFIEDGEGLELGRALGCMNDEQRTIKFIQGLYGALGNLDVRREEIEMVDAGTGPIPLFGILAALKSSKVKVTCLELNKGSAKMAEKIIERLGLQERVKVICTDATKYQHDKPIDLLISETMHVGLTEEPQAQIFDNLAPQVNADGVVIPESVIVKAGLVGEMDARKLAGALPNIKDGLRPEFVNRTLQYASAPVEVAQLSRGSLLDSVRVDLPVDGLPEGDYRLALSSSVRVFGDIVLEKGDSPITAPSVNGTVLNISDKVKRVSAGYVPGTKMEDVNVVAEK